MEFSFTEDQIDRLFDAFESSERLRVVACNGMGDPCELEGYIGIVGKKEMPILEEEEDDYTAGILENALILDCGKISQFPEEYYRTPYSTMLFTDHKALDLPPQPLLYIKSIRSIDKNDVIYCNYEFDDLLYFFKNTKSAFEKERIKHGKLPAWMDKDGKFLNDNVGKPMDIGNQKGIVTLATEIVPSGDICLFGMTGPNIFTTFLQKDKKVSVQKGVIVDSPRELGSASPAPEM